MKGVNWEVTQCDLNFSRIFMAIFSKKEHRESKMKEETSSGAYRTEKKLLDRWQWEQRTESFQTQLGKEEG